GEVACLGRVEGAEQERLSGTVHGDTYDHGGKELGTRGWGIAPVSGDDVADPPGDTVGDRGQQLGPDGAEVAASLIVEQQSEAVGVSGGMIEEGPHVGMDLLLKGKIGRLFISGEQSAGELVCLATQA